MLLDDFDYHLPADLIANYPLAQRSSSRMLVMNKQTQTIAHQQFTDLLDHITPGDLLVLNNSRVIPARLFGHKVSGGKVELLIERILDEQCALCHIRASKAPKIGSHIQLEPEGSVTVVGKDDHLYTVSFTTSGSALSLIEKIGHMPLPPYIARADEDSDKSRYQTVYSQAKGSVAAPTAGLHFDEAMLSKIRDKGVGIAFVTLHVGAGTFQPVRVTDITQHHMHREWLVVDQSVCAAVEKTKAQGKKVIAVGTTSVRSLETASAGGILAPFSGDSQLFIYPGYQFHTVDMILTNFHLPKSSLLMLVSAFAGHELTMKSYQAAVEQRYRFYSYGDCMLIGR